MSGKYLIFKLTFASRFSLNSWDSSMIKYAIHESDSSLVVCKTHVLSKCTCISELFRDILYWKQINKRFSFRQKKTMLLRWQKVKNTKLIKSIYHTVIIFKRWPLKRYSFGPTKSWLVFDSYKRHINSHYR